MDKSRLLSILSSSLSSRWLFIPPVVLGALVLVWMLRNRTGPVKAPPAEAVRSLRVIHVPQVAMVPRVFGYGTAQPRDVWNAVAEVKGTVVSVHPELKAGVLLRKDTEVLKIDPAEYQLRIAQLQADIAQVESQQAELTTQEANYRASLKIERSSLSLAERDLARLRGLASSSSVTESEVERKEREVLSQRQLVQNLENALNTLPAQHESLAAQLSAKQAALDLAKLDLSHTVITAPFDCRLSDVSIEKGQFLTTGQVLFAAHGIDVTEIEAQLPLDQARNLIDPDHGPIDVSGNPMEVIRKVFDVQAIVRMRTGDFEVEWQGRFDRLREQLDQQTRTVRVVVAVDKPYENVIPGKRPPLSPGMFCEVELRGKPRPDQIVIPRSALRTNGDKGGHVYVVSPEERLERRDVQIAMIQDGIVVVRSGLEPGELLVVSDPTPAIMGMRIDAVRDEAVEKRLISDASGGAGDIIIEDASDEDAVSEDASDGDA